MAGAARLLSQLRNPMCPFLQLVSRFGASICTISERAAIKDRACYSMGSIWPSATCGTTSSSCSGRSEGGWSSSAVLNVHMRGSYLCQARAYSDTPSGTGRNGGGREDRPADEEIPGDTMGSVLPDATQFKPSGADGEMDGPGMDESGSDYGGAAAGLMATGFSNHDGENEVSSDVEESWGEAGLDFDAAMDDMDDIGKLGALVESAGENAAAALLAARSQTDPEAHLAREAREKKSEFFKGVPQRLMKQRRKEAIKTGALIDPLSQYIEGRQHPTKVTAGWCAEVVDIKMTQARTASGTRYTYSSMAVVGNMRGWGGWAIGKSSEPDRAVNKAILRAIKDAVFIPRYRGHTIYSAMFVKHTRTKLFMWPRERGFGIVGHPLLIEICELLGLQDITVKVHGSRLTRNMVKAFFAALQLIKTPRDRAMGQQKYIREVTPYVRSVLSSPAS